MCRDHEFHKVGRRRATLNREATPSRLPLVAAWITRSLCLAGIATVLASLSMSSDYGQWSFNRDVSQTWELVVVTIIIAVFLIITIPLVLWWLTATATAIFFALTPRGPKESLLLPLLAMGTLLSWLLPWLIAAPTWEGTSRPPLWGSFVFAIGCTLVFFSTLPGLYYWIKLRLPGKNKKRIF